jgi:hypothetical protein
VKRVKIFSPQLHQNINLLFLLVVGSYVAHIYLGWRQIIAILFFSLVIEHSLLYLNSDRKFYFSYATLSTAVGVIVLMYATQLWIYLFAITLGLFQKHFITIQGKHLFNPSNFALVMVLLFFYQDAHMATGQLGDAPWLVAVISLLAVVILVRVDRWIIPLAFVVFYLGFEYFLVVGYDVTVLFEDIYERFYAATFVLFIYFMLTDPPVTPTRRSMQVLYASYIALIAAGMDRYFGYRVQHLFMAVFLLSPLVTLYQVKLEKSTRFKWLLIILLATLGIISMIEMQPPYYFEMDG